MAKSKIRLKKTVSIALTVLSVLIFLFAVCIFALTVYAKSNGRQLALFGYSFSVVVTPSMEPEISVGELVVVKHCDIEEAQIGQNAVYIAQKDPIKGQRIIHKIEQIVADDGEYYIITRGVAADVADDPVYAEDFVGIGVWHSAFLGGVVVFFSNTFNWIFLAVFLFGVWLAVRQIKKLISYAKPAPEEENKTDDSKANKNQS